MKVLLLLITIAFLSSCSNIYFTEPQPVGGKNLNEFPEAIIGVYQVPTTNTTFKIEKNKITDGDGDVTFLSDSLIVRKLNDYYVINARSDGEKNSSLKGYWNVFLMKTNDCDNLEIIDFAVGQNKENINYFTEKYDAIIIKDEPIELEELEMEEMEMEELEELEMEMEELEMEELEMEEMEMEVNIEAIVLKVTKKEFSEFIKSEKLGSPIILKNIKNK